MVLSTLDVSEFCDAPFQTYLLGNKVKAMLREYEFYDVKFVLDVKSPSMKVLLQYPYGNPFWFSDLKRTVTEFCETHGEYADDWRKLLGKLHDRIKAEFKALDSALNGNVSPKHVATYMTAFGLRDYQAYDAIQLAVKYRTWGNRGLILSDPRTGKTRIALSLAWNAAKDPDSVILIICPKSACAGWAEECDKVNALYSPVSFSARIVSKISDLKNLEMSMIDRNVRIISYDLFKRLKIPQQIRQLTSKAKNVMLIIDEAHRLRNFKTQQSDAIFAFKESCARDKVSLGILGLTGTPSVKASDDVFGLLCLINESKIAFRPHYNAFNSFKEYFYFCEDTTFGKIAKSLRREDELNYIIRTCSVQTKQRSLEMFRNYRKEYRKVLLSMEEEQKRIYDEVYEHMEYDDVIDCQNKLVQLTRLQQICIDPSTIIPTYSKVSPKLRWVCGFAKKNPSLRFIVCAKKAMPLKHLDELMGICGISHRIMIGATAISERATIAKEFMEGAFNVLLLQLDVGKEALTLPCAGATVFLDRDFAQGFNEQAEARMTPIDGTPCVKYVYDLVMDGTKEEGIYDTLIIRKESINAINTVFKPRKEK